MSTMGDFVRDVMTGLGYGGLALLVALENVFPPIPSEVILPLSGFYVQRGEFAFLPALASSTAGSVAGALALYWLARARGRRGILRMGRVLRVDEDDLTRMQDGFRRHGVLYVAVARLIPGLRSAVSVPAGISHMGLASFTALTAVRSAAWNALLIGAGMFLGSRYERVSDVIGPASAVVVGLLVVGGAVWITRRRRRAGSADPARSR